MEERLKKLGPEHNEEAIKEVRSEFIFFVIIRQFFDNTFGIRISKSKSSELLLKPSLNDIGSPC